MYDHSWICDECGLFTNDLSETQRSIWGEDMIWICPRCHEEIEQEKLEDFESLHGQVGQYFNTLSNLMCGRDVAYPIYLGWPHQFKMYCQWYRLPDGQIILSAMPSPPENPTPITLKFKGVVVDDPELGNRVEWFWRA